MNTIVLGLLMAVAACGHDAPVAPSPVTTIPAEGFTVKGTLHESPPAGGLGVPISGARVEVLAKPGVIASALTDAAGAYVFSGMAGTFDLRVGKPGYQTLTTSVQRVVGDRVVDLAIPPVPQRLTGIVFETPPTQSTRVAGVRVTVASGPNTGVSAMSDATGRYSLPSMWGTFDIELSRDGYATGSRRLTMTGEELSLDLQIAPAAKTITDTFVADRATPRQFRAAFQVHNPGEIAVVDWWAVEFEEGDGSMLQIYEDGTLVAQTFVERSFPRNKTVLRVKASAGKTYEVRGSSPGWRTATISHPS